MPKKVKKVFGENPEVVTVLDTQVDFDENGDALVEDEIADILEQIPGYEVLAEELEETPDNTASEDEGEEEPVSEEGEEDEDEEEAKPKRPTRKAPKRG
jgi:hypothetical protein